jgi:hypothetical protein
MIEFSGYLVLWWKDHVLFFFQQSRLVKILIVTMMASEVFSWYYFSNGWLCISIIDHAHARAEKEIKDDLPELLLGLLLPVSPPTASLSCYRWYRFMSLDALLDPSTGQRGPLGPSVDWHWYRFSGGMTPRCIDIGIDGYKSVSGELQHFLHCTTCSASCAQFCCGFCFILHI